MITLVILWALGFFWAEVFVCDTDFTIQWKTRETAAMHCTDHGLELLLFAISDLVGDVLIVLMPFPCIRDLHMSRREKWAVAFIFLLGTL